MSRLRNALQFRLATVFMITAGIAVVTFASRYGREWALITAVLGGSLYGACRGQGRFVKTLVGGAAGAAISAWAVLVVAFAIDVSSSRFTFFNLLPWFIKSTLTLSASGICFGLAVGVCVWLLAAFLRRYVAILEPFTRDMSR